MRTPAEFCRLLLMALSEIVGCYLMLLWVKLGASALALVGAAISLAPFA